MHVWKYGHSPTILDPICHTCGCPISAARHQAVGPVRGQPVQASKYCGSMFPVVELTGAIFLRQQQQQQHKTLDLVVELAW